MDSKAIHICVAIIFDDVVMLKYLIECQKLTNWDIRQLCTLSIRRGSYNCFCYLNNLHGTYDFPFQHLLVSMNMNIFLHLENLNVIGSKEILIIYRCSKKVNRVDIVEYIESKYHEIVNQSDNVDICGSEVIECPVWSQIDIIVSSWKEGKYTYENFIQWLPREVLENAIMSMLEGNTYDVEYSFMSVY